MNAPVMAVAKAEETVQEKIARLEAENAALKNKKGAQTVGKLSVRMSAKGGVSVYGLGRFPVTLYGSQWERLLAVAPEIVNFMVANSDKLSTKE